MHSLVRILVVLVAGSIAACAAPSSHHERYRLIGYVAGWQPATRIDVEKLTAINYAFAHIAAGAVVLDAPRAVDFLAGLRALKARNPRLEILVSVGGWGADGFSDAALDDASRSRFAQSAAELLARNELDGIDLDWEYPGLAGPGIGHRVEDRRNFTLLLRALRRRLDALGAEHGGKHYRISAALADGEFVANIELDRIHGFMDWINLMTYDFHNSLTPTTGHHAALSASATSAAGERSVERAVAQFLAAGVPPRKLIVGVPFYGRAFAGVRAKDHGLDQPYDRYDGDYAWPRLEAEFIGRDGFVRYRDASAQAPYLWNEQSRTFISYDDPQSLAAKARFVRAQGLGGMMYWEQSQDPDGELLGALSGALQASPASR